MSKKKRRQSGRLFPVLLLCFLSVALLALMISRASGLKASETAAIEPASGHTAAPGTAAPGPGSSPAGNASPAPAQAEITPEPAPTPVPEPEYFTISMVGDCTLAEAKTRRGWTSYFQDVVKQNYAYPFANTRSWLEDDYLTIANLECCLSDKYRGYPSNAPYDSIEQFVFLAPAEYAEILTEGSVEFVTLANNHTMDFGVNAFNDTTAALDAAGVSWAGEDETFIYQTDGGLRVGIYCLYNGLTGNSLGLLSAERQAALAEDSKALIRAGLQSLRDQGAEYAVACLHMGTEGSYETSAIQVELCRATIDAGFDLVYCTHSHRLQPAEEYSGGMIFYGMGNWIFGGNNNPGYGTDPAAYDTGIARVTVCRLGNSVTLDSVEFIPCSISSSVDPDTGTLSTYSLNNYQPTPYTRNSAAWERTMSILRGEYAGSNYVPNYGDVLSQMNAG